MSGAAYPKSGTRYDPGVRRPAACLAIALCLACESKKPPAPTPTPNGVENIRGTERVGWDQQAADTVELAAFRYAMYVDGVRSEAADVTCSTTAGANGFSCSGRLPQMSPGQHTLELATFVLDGGTIVESGRSSPLRVNVTASVMGAPAVTLTSGQIVTTRDGAQFRLEVVHTGVDEPEDVAVDERGRLFVAERARRVRVIESDDRQHETEIAEADALLSLALDPDFNRTHLVYVVHTAAARDGSVAPVFRLSRYREVDGRLGERAILLDGVPARSDAPSAFVRFGTDGKLYVAFDDGGDARNVDAAASLNGKLLRLNADGTTPEDQPRASPVHVGGFTYPRGIAWLADGSLWMADGEPQGERLVAAGLSSTRPRRATVRAVYSLDAGSDASDAVIQRGDLFVASGGGHLLRVRLDPDTPSRMVSSEKLLEGFVDSVRALAARADGTIYFATPSVIARLVPQ